MYIRDPSPSIEGATVVVTTFRCRSLAAMMWIRWRAFLLTKEIAGLGDGLMISTFTSRLRQRTICNVSVWRDRQAVYTMGRSDRHVRLTRRVRVKRLADTESIVFDSAGEWREVLFREPHRREMDQSQEASRGIN
jgi:hypothetical protein